MLHYSLDFLVKIFSNEVARTFYPPRYEGGSGLPLSPAPDRLCFLQNPCAPQGSEEVGGGPGATQGRDRTRGSWQVGRRKARGESESWDACEEARTRAMQVSAPDGPDFSERKIPDGEEREGMEFASSSRGSPGPLVSRATGDVLASHFLNQSIIAIF